MRTFWDLPLLLLITAACSISLLIIYSINKNLAANQMVFWLVGFLGLAIASVFDYRNWQHLSKWLYLSAIVLLVLVFFLGEPVRGSVRWINLGAFRFQPSELAKIASVFTLAAFYKNRSAAAFKNLAFSFLIVLPLITLVFREPDIGNSLSILAIWFGVSVASGFRLKALLTLLIIGALISIFSYELLAPYQKERINSFINPSSDPLATGYNVIQSKIAVGSGKFLGRGLGRGSQSLLNFLPESESDFIFAAASEQLGLIGAAILIAAFSAVILKVLSYAKDIDRFGALIITGIVSFLLFQFVVNIGMNMGLVPVTGITFPLVSYGGSSLVSTLFLLGVALSIKRAKNWGVKYYEYPVF